jgi:hypothetical protein
MTRRAKILLPILVLWGVITVIYAYSYAARRVHSPLADPGYETTYGFQLLAFAVTRISALIALLGLALAIAEFYVRRGSR